MEFDIPPSGPGGGKVGRRELGKFISRTVAKQRFRSHRQMREARAGEGAARAALARGDHAARCSIWKDRKG